MFSTQKSRVMALPFDQINGNLAANRRGWLPPYRSIFRFGILLDGGALTKSELSESFAETTVNNHLSFQPLKSKFCCADRECFQNISPILLILMK